MLVQCSGQHHGQAEQIWKNHHGHDSLKPFSHDQHQEQEVVDQFHLLKMLVVVYGVQWEEGA